MPLLDDNLTIWEISFRWAGLDSGSLKYRLYIPTTVKDNIRLLTQAIITNVLFIIGDRPLIIGDRPQLIAELTMKIFS